MRNIRYETIEPKVLEYYVENPSDNLFNKSVKNVVKHPT